MVQINFARKEINCKLVYYGPGLSGKTTNLEKVHERTPPANKGELTSISTDGDRTLFFDFMPLDLGEIAGMKTKFHLYTVPGQVYYNSTRKLVLLGADGVIFVADSSAAKMAENHESLENLRQNLAEMGKDLAKFPLVIQWNKRDMPDALPVEQLEAELNKVGVPSFPAVAYKGEGVFQTLKALSALVLKNISSTDASTSPSSGARTAAPDAAAAAKAREAAAALRAPATVGAAAPAPARPAVAARPAAARPAAAAPLAIERNEVAVRGRPDAAPARKAPERVAAERVAVPRGPLDEIGAASARKTEPAEWRPSAQPAGAAAPAAEVAAGADEVAPAVAQSSEESSSDRMGRHGRGRAEHTLRRDVRVIGGRPGGTPARSAPGGSGSAVWIVVVGIGAAAAAAAWFLLT